jgi:hypothetical protein
VSADISIGKAVTLDKPVHDLSGTERPAGARLIVEQVAHEHTRDPIILATPSDWARSAVTHRTAHQIQIGGEFCFYLDDLGAATDGVPF